DRGFGTFTRDGSSLFDTVTVLTDDPAFRTAGNTPAAFAERAVTASVDENGVAVLTGLPTGPDPLGNFILFGNWGRGPAEERFEFESSAQPVRLEHRYLDSRSSYPIDLRWFDDHAGGNSDTLSVAVNNLAPALSLAGPPSAVASQKVALQLGARDASP